MATVLVRNLFGGDPAAAGTYTLVGGVWTKGTYSFSNDDGGVGNTEWELNNSAGGGSTLETSGLGDTDSPASAPWDKYSVTDVSSPGKLPVGSGTGESVSSPGTLNPVAPGVPDAPENYVGTFEQTLTDLQKSQALQNIQLESLANGYYGTATVADRPARLALDKTLSRIIQNDLPEVMWILIAEDPSFDSSWVGLPSTVDPNGSILVTMELADVLGTVPDDHVLARRGSAIVKGDGVTTGGILVESPHKEITMVIVGSNNAKFYYAEGTLGSVDSAATYVSIGTAVTILGANVFSGLSITAVSIPNSVVEFEEYCFASSSLTSIKIPDSVTTLGESCLAFTPLTTITIPASVTSIGDSVFEDCSNLVEVNCFVPETVFGAGANVLNTQGLPITLHVRSDDNTWDALVAASPSSYQGNTVTVVKDL